MCKAGVAAGVTAGVGALDAAAAAAASSAFFASQSFFTSAVTGLIGGSGAEETALLGVEAASADALPGAAE